ncbi:MAG: hypothetical protein LBC17_02335 [Lactobacillaceae bacterium]|nr:hypothetical protein [Lactobacillaceae bacterium]
MWIGSVPTLQLLKRNTIKDSYKLLSVSDFNIILATDLSENIFLILGGLFFLVFNLKNINPSFVQIINLIIFLILSLFLRYGLLSKLNKKRNIPMIIVFLDKNFIVSNFLILLISLQFSLLNQKKWWFIFPTLVLIFLIILLVSFSFKKIKNRLYISFESFIQYYLIEYKIAIYESGGILSGLIFNLFLGPALMILFAWYFKNNIEQFQFLSESKLKFTKYIVIYFVLFEILQSALVSIFAFDVERKKMQLLRYLGNFWLKKFKVKYALYLLTLISISFGTTIIVYFVDYKMLELMVLASISSISTLSYNMFFQLPLEIFKKYNFHIHLV